MANALTLLQTIFFSSGRRKLLTGIGSVFVIGIVWFFFGREAPKPLYQTAQVTKGTIMSTVTESGNVASNGQVSVGSPTDGVIEAIYVKNGDIVAAGQNVLQVKSTATPQEVASAYAQYLAAQNTVATAQSQLYTLQNDEFVANQKFMNDAVANNKATNDPVYIEENAAWLAAEAAYKNQQQVIAQAQAAENAAALSYQQTQDVVVTSPIAGTVANMSVQVGDSVTSSTNSSTATSTSGTSLLTIGNFSTPYIKVAASEVDIPAIHAGQKATITLSAFPDKTFVGEVSQVDSVGTISSGVVSYNVYITFIAPPASIKPGMSATVAIETARKDNVLTVPSTAIQHLNGQTTIRVMQQGQPTAIPVTTGISSDTDTEILSGLTDGQTIVISSVFPNSSGSSTASPFSGLGGRGFGGGFGGGARATGRGGN